MSALLRCVYISSCAALVAALPLSSAFAQPDDSGNWLSSPDEDPAFERWQHRDTGEYIWLKKSELSLPTARKQTTTVAAPARPQPTPKAAAKPVSTVNSQNSGSTARRSVPAPYVPVTRFNGNNNSTFTESYQYDEPTAREPANASADQPPVSQPVASSKVAPAPPVIAEPYSAAITPYVVDGISPPPTLTLIPPAYATTTPRFALATQPATPAPTASRPPINLPAPAAASVADNQPALIANQGRDLQPVCAPDSPSSGDPRTRRPGQSAPVLRYEPEDCDPTRLPPPVRKSVEDFAAVPDRWRIVGGLGYDENLLDPYSGFNVLKGDRPVHGEWFFSILAAWDSIWEPRSFPVPVGNATTQDSGELDLIGRGDQTVLASNLITEFVYYRGDTVFRPPDWEFRFTPVFNINQVEFEERGLTNADPSVGRIRRDTHIGIQSAFVDYHIRNVSTRYDFDSIRFGIQPYNHDFRGFLFLDQPFGLRLFGTRDNNIFQYNLGLFRRLEKDTNSGLNDASMRMRDDDVFVANVFWQDLFKLGFISQFSLLYNRNREADQTLFDRNQFIARPSSLGVERARDYDVTYLGYSGDGHFGRMNLSVSVYSALGRESNGTFNNQKSNIQAWFAAFETGFDMDWVRYRFSFLYGSGDSDPFDDKAEGFDSVFENPIFAGADTSYWIRQTVPLIGGGRVALSGRNGILNSLRSTKEQGQSNFVNPGIILLGLGADLDLSTTFRLSFNINQLWFDDSTVLEVARNQGNIDEEIGTDISAAIIYRPFATQNVVFRLSGALLRPGEGFKNLFGDEDHYSILGNLTLVY